MAAIGRFQKGEDIFYAKVVDGELYRLRGDVFGSPSFDKKPTSIKGVARRFSVDTHHETRWLHRPADPFAQNAPESLVPPWVVRRLASGHVSLPDPDVTSGSAASLADRRRTQVITAGPSPAHE